MTPTWHFLRQRPSEKVRNPIQGEYFSDDAIENPAQALVREVCQNSIDARLPDNAGPVTVRFTVRADDRRRLLLGQALLKYHRLDGHTPV